MLSDVSVQPMLPVKDLEEAKRFYEGVLGLNRIDEMPGVAVTYQSGSSTFNVYRSDFAGTNKGTAALWEIEDVEGTAKELKARGVSFEKYDNMPGTTREGDVHHAGDLKVVWFKDPTGNILSIQNRPARARRG
jgi:catechol 2,3-dioxygenase-like lactoylglutathione lyase family enzyme